MFEKDANFAAYMEVLRKEYKIRQDTLCEGICSVRNYRRYLNGEIKLPIDIVAKFCEKLDISISDFYISYSLNFSKDQEKITELYNCFSTKDYDSFYKKAKLIDPDNFSQTINKKIFIAFNIRADYLTKKISSNEAYRRASELINYPECLKRDAFDFLDAFTLMFILTIEVKEKKTQALNRFIDILLERETHYLSHDFNMILPTIYTNVSLELGKLNRYDDCLKICNEGINFSNKYQIYYSIPKLRYVKSYCLLVLGRQKEAEIEGIKALFAAISQDRKYEVSEYHRILKKDFGIDVFNLVAEYKGELLNLEDKE